MFLHSAETNMKVGAFFKCLVEENKTLSLSLFEYSSQSSK